MRSPLAFTPGRGRVGEAPALAATLYFASLAVLALAVANPILLAGAAAAAVVAGRAAGAGDALALVCRWGLAMGILFVAVNALASQRGDTILVRGFDLPVLGTLDVSAEAVVEGAALALRVLVVMMVFAVYSATVDPDRLLRFLRPVAGRSALTASLLTRLVPVAAADYARLRDAAALRGPAAAPVTRAAMARRLVAGSLDRAMDVAATLELRGFALGAPRSPGGVRSSRYRWRFPLAGALILGATATALATEAGEFSAYPTVTIAHGPWTFLLAAAVAAAAALPFAIRGGRDG